MLAITHLNLVVIQKIGIILQVIAKIVDTNNILPKCRNVLDVSLHLLFETRQSPVSISHFL